MNTRTITILCFNCEMYIKKKKNDERHKTVIECYRISCYCVPV